MIEFKEEKKKALKKGDKKTKKKKGKTKINTYPPSTSYPCPTAASHEHSKPKEKNFPQQINRTKNEISRKPAYAQHKWHCQPDDNHQTKLVSQAKQRQTPHHHGHRSPRSWHNCTAATTPHHIPVRTRRSVDGVGRTRAGKSHTDRGKDEKKNYFC